MLVHAIGRAAGIDRFKRSSFQMYLAAGIAIAIFAYSSVSRTSLLLLTCFEVNGETRLQVAPDVLCYQGAHLFPMILSIILVLVYVLPMPGAFAVVLHHLKTRARDPLRPLERNGLTDASVFRKFGIHNTTSLRLSSLCLCEQVHSMERTKSSCIGTNR